MLISHTYRAAADAVRSRQEAVMDETLTRHYPVVVPRSSFRQLRALLALALVLVACLSVAVVILANNDEAGTTATPYKFEPIAYGGFNPATGSPLASTARQTGGPEESGVAAAIAPKPVPVKPNVATPDESKVAASIARAQLAKQGQPAPQSGPDESSVAAAIAGR
jgi:hypothetical protein